MVYNQPDTEQPGFNPNEEHALLSGDTLYALRDDLNALNNMSDPYVLLKYYNADAGEWMMDVYQVKRPTSFTYSCRSRLADHRAASGFFSDTCRKRHQDGPGWVRSGGSLAPARPQGRALGKGRELEERRCHARR